MIKDTIHVKRETVGAHHSRRVSAHDRTNLGHASLFLQHMRPKDWRRNKRTGLLEPDYRWKESQIGPVIDLDSAELVYEGESINVKTNTGIVFLHTQGYGTSPGANGLNYFALSNDTVTETSASTVLSNEIVANGLERAIGVVVLPTGSGVITTISKTFTCNTLAQAAQKAGLLTAGSGGILNHVLAFSGGQRTLQIGDTLALTASITLS